MSYLKNSSNAAFFQPAAGTYYVMLSGRWFSTKSTPPAVAASAPAPLVSGLWGKMLSATKPPAKPTVTATLSVADAFKGPWTYVSPDQLPEGFRKIPPSFSQGSVLASIPGTQEAEDAAMDAEIPQTTVIDKKKASFKATYDGEP
ncbi:MAG: hypothetical protein K8R69_04150, partial [Deltaproteobacteria bacterium]|nr:hypothetical protein [Deltaproteobacteria bacterium]